MSFDLFQSRNTYNEPCKWWKRDERDQFDPDELVFKRVPDGTFMAKEVSPQRDQNIQVGGSFMFDRTSVTIKSPDNLEDIKSEYIVEYQGEKWIVVSVQKSKARMQNTFFAADKNCSHYWYLELRK